MTAIDYNRMSLDDLRQYVLTHRDDTNAFHLYIDRSKTAGRMISINLDDSHWEENLADRLHPVSTDEG